LPSRAEDWGRRSVGGSGGAGDAENVLAAGVVAAAEEGVAFGAALPGGAEEHLLAAAGAVELLDHRLTRRVGGNLAKGDRGGEEKEKEMGPRE